MPLIPLFPLNTVLYPGMGLPLRIFEQRYRHMIGECLDRGTAFGVALIKEGAEVGEPVVPFDVGTTARITNSETRPNGRIHITTRGERRFRIIEMTQRVPYVMGRVEYMDEPSGDDVDAVADAVGHATSEYVRLLIGLRGGWMREVRLPADPAALSYFVAQHMEAEASLKQALLEMPTARERLQRELPLVTAAVKRTRATFERDHPVRKRLN